MLMKGLNRTQLKTIAILAMVCDHIAWGFLDFHSVRAQVMHLIGRMTIPIMCYFIAEGCHKTSNIRKYIGRMVIFWLLSVIPFYAFFHEIYDYRQNIIFDLLLGLLAIMVWESKKSARITKLILMAFLLFISAIVGGWPIFPMISILIFYYSRDFKTLAKRFCTLTIGLVVLLVIVTILNQIYHFSHYEWIWYDKLYFFGFMIPLFLLKHYNGQRGSGKYGSYFFYLFYPLHFCVLAAMKTYGYGSDWYYAYLCLNILVIILGFSLVFTVARSNPSKAQSANLVLISFSIVYMFGVMMEITAETVEGMCSAIRVEYFGESMMIIGLTWFVSEFFKTRIHPYIYAAESVVAFLTMLCMFTMEYNHLFYTKIQMNYEGSFPRVDLSYGIGFYLFVTYLAVVCIAAVIIGIKTMKNSEGLEYKRYRYMLIGFICPWAAIALRELGVTGGYEVSALGILGTIVFVSLSWIKYGYFDSVKLAGENALNHGTEGIMVLGTNRRIVFLNRLIGQLFPEAEIDGNAYEINSLKDIIEGRLKQLTVGSEIYEMRIEPLIELGYTQGYMLWAINMTEHYHVLNEVQEIAYTDALTGLNNRNYFRTSVVQYMRLGGSGYMVMGDLDNFKNVNDTYGHAAGDAVLIKMAEVLKNVSQERHFSSRIGGDEFCMFFKSSENEEKMRRRAEYIIEEFQRGLVEIGYEAATSVSLGIAKSSPWDEEGDSFEELYRNADRALYMAKNKKGEYRFY